MSFLRSAICLMFISVLLLQNVSGRRSKSGRRETRGVNRPSRQGRDNRNGGRSGRDRQGKENRGERGGYVGIESPEPTSAYYIPPKPTSAYYIPVPPEPEETPQPTPRPTEKPTTPEPTGRPTEKPTTPAPTPRPTERPTTDSPTSSSPTTSSPTPGAVDIPLCLNPMNGRMEAVVECDDPCKHPLTGCPKFPTAQCTPNYCGGCHETYKPDCGCKNPMTGEAADEVECSFDPCQDVGCTLHPTAMCTPSNCGDCFPVFTDSATGEVVECDPPAAETCTNPLTGEEDTMVACDDDPCEHPVVGCPKFPAAACVSNYCGGCFETYKPDCGCVNPMTGEADDEVQCLMDPCQDVGCALHPSAICTADYCGGCHAIFTDSDGEVVECEPPAPETCMNPLTEEQDIIVDCDEDPCENPTVGCPNFPSAACTANYCGGCHETYKPDCGCVNPVTGDVDYEVACIVDPCDVIPCTLVPDATCSSNYCGGCHAVYTDAEGTVVQCEEVVEEPEECTNPVTGLRDTMVNAEECANPCEYPAIGCPKFPDAECVPNYCGGCHETYKPDCGCKNPMTGEADDFQECVDYNPCEYASCPDYSDASCEVNQCGGCFATFKDTAGNTLDCEIPQARSFVGRTDDSGTRLLTRVLDWFTTQYPTATVFVTLCGLAAMAATIIYVLGSIAHCVARLQMKDRTSGRYDPIDTSSDVSSEFDAADV